MQNNKQTSVPLNIPEYIDIYDMNMLVNIFNHYKYTKDEKFY